MGRWHDVSIITDCLPRNVTHINPGAPSKPDGTLESRVFWFLARQGTVLYLIGAPVSPSCFIDLGINTATSKISSLAVITRLDPHASLMRNRLY